MDNPINSSESVSPNQPEQLSLSIVISTHKRPDALQFLVSHLLASAPSAWECKYEIVLIGDSSADIPAPLTRNCHVKGVNVGDFTSDDADALMKWAIGTSKARGEFVAIASDDDLLFWSHLSEAVKILRKSTSAAYVVPREVRILPTKHRIQKLWWPPAPEFTGCLASNRLASYAISPTSIFYGVGRRNQTLRRLFSVATAAPQPLMEALIEILTLCDGEVVQSEPLGLIRRKDQSHGGQFVKTEFCHGGIQKMSLLVASLASGELQGHEVEQALSDLCQTIRNANRMVPRKISGLKKRMRALLTISSILDELGDDNADAFRQWRAV